MASFNTVPPEIHLQILEHVSTMTPRDLRNLTYASSSCARLYLAPNQKLRLLRTAVQNYVGEYHCIALAHVRAIEAHYLLLNKCEKSEGKWRRAKGAIVREVCWPEGRESTVDEVCEWEWKQLYRSHRKVLETVVMIDWRIANEQLESRFWQSDEHQAALSERISNLSIHTENWRNRLASFKGFQVSPSIEPSGYGLPDELARAVEISVLYQVLLDEIFNKSWMHLGYPSDAIIMKQLIDRSFIEAYNDACGLPWRIMYDGLKRVRGRVAKAMETVMDLILKADIYNIDINNDLSLNDMISVDIDPNLWSLEDLHEFIVSQDLQSRMYLLETTLLHAVWEDGDNFEYEDSGSSGSNFDAE